MLAVPDAAAEPPLGHWSGASRRVFAHEIRHDMIETQRRLGELAEQTRHRINAWAQRPRHIEVRDHALALPPVPLVPAPGPPPSTTTDDQLVDGQGDQIDALAQHCNLLDQVIRGFDSTVPTNFKVRVRPHLPDAYAGVQDAWLEEFFAWTDPLVVDQGLFLWT